MRRPRHAFSPASAPSRRKAAEPHSAGQNQPQSHRYQESFAQHEASPRRRVHARASRTLRDKQHLEELWQNGAPWKSWYGTMAPSRRKDCAPDYAILTQYDRYRRERQAFPQEYAAYRELIAKGSVVAIYKPIAGISGGPVVTIVAFHRREPYHTQ